MKFKLFNINNYVEVQLTKEGKAELSRRAKELRDQFPTITHKYTLPEEDKDGWSKWQLWCLMQALGHMCSNGMSIPFKTEIRIQT